MGEAARTRTPDIQLFRDVFNASPIGIAVETLEGQPLFVNPAFCSMLGFSEEELRNKHCVDFSPPEDAQKDWALFQQLKAGSIDHYQLEKRYFRRDGSLVWGRLSISLLNSRPSPLLVAMVEEITDKKATEEALRTSEELLKIFVKHVPAAVAMLDRDMRYLQVSNRWCSDNSVEASELLGRSRELSPEMPDRWKEVNRRALQGETLRADEDRWESGGSTRWARWEVRPWRAADGTVGGILILTEDITRRKQMEETLRESEDKLRLLLDSTAEAIYGIDLEHRCTFCNPACLRALGYERIDEVLGKNMHDLMHHSRADRALYPVEDCPIHRVTQTGKGVHEDDELMSRTDGTSFPVEYWSYPQRRGDEIVGAVVAFNDITERKLAESALAKVSLKLIEAQEQERARIARELHDDINQRLAMLGIELQQLREHYPDLPVEISSRMEELRKQTAGISNDVQALSHELHSSKLEYLGAIGGMKSWCKEFGERQGIQIEFKSTEVQTSVAPEVGLCLFRVLQEALHNAAKHSGVRRIEVQLQEDSGEIHLVISDLGRGFDLETAMQGRGLGLTSMQERIRLVNGTIEIQSKPMGGTTVHVRVPFKSERVSERAAVKQRA
jgi:PAS domain S-box-containing protein